MYARAVLLQLHYVGIVRIWRVHDTAAAPDSSALRSAIVATFGRRIPLLHSSQWSGGVASSSFSRIRHFHCCHFIAGVTVLAEIVNYATALDTIGGGQRGGWWPRDRTAPHYRAPPPPQPRFSFVSNKLIRVVRDAPLVGSLPGLRSSDSARKSTLQPLITDICRLMWAYGISEGCARENIA